MLVQCPCQQCQGPIEFELEDRGTIALCPHCGAETLLSSQPAQLKKAQIEDRKERKSRMRTTLRITLVVLGAVLICLVMYAAGGWFFGQSTVATPQPDVRGFGTPAEDDQVGEFLLGTAILILVIMWILFPVIVYLQLRTLASKLDTLNQTAASMLSRLSHPTEDSQARDSR